jgi:hypothetical protein
MVNLTGEEDRETPRLLNGGSLAAARRRALVR